MVAQTNYSCAASFERSQDSTAIVNGEVMHTAHPVARPLESHRLAPTCMYFSVPGLQLLLCDVLTAHVGQQLLFVHI